MEEWSQDCFMEIKEFFNGFLIKKDRNTTIVLENFSDLLSLTIVLRDYTRPSNPYYLYHFPLLS